MFKPDRVIYPAAGKHEILVAGEVDGEARNETITNEALAASYREAIQNKNIAIDQATKVFEATNKELDKQAFELATKQYEVRNTPVANPEE